MKNIVPFCAIILISACETNSDNDVASDLPPVTYDATSGVRGTGFALVEYNPTSDTYTFRRNAARFVLDGNINFDYGSFDGASDGTGQLLFSSSTDTSFVSLGVLAGLGAGVRMERPSTATAPASGFTTLTGDYLAAITDATTLETTMLISGNAQVDLNFTDGTSEGVITQRILRNANDNTVISGVAVDDLTLEMGSLDRDSGVFSGVTSGGNIDLTTLGPAWGQTVGGTGSYNVTLTGATGEEAVGSLSFVHTGPNIDPETNISSRLIERGALALGH